MRDLKVLALVSMLLLPLAVGCGEEGVVLEPDAGGPADTSPGDTGDTGNVDADAAVDADAGPDGCDADETLCGEACCSPEETCVDGVCRCTPESDSDYCMRNKVACGPLSLPDNCGKPRSVTSCGPCYEPSECIAGKCIACEHESDGSFCHNRGKTCGRLTVPDNCGTVREVGCGNCESGTPCVENVCEAGRVPANDTCDAPEELYFINGVVKLSVDLTTSGPSFALGYPCGGTQNALKDRVFHIKVDSFSELTIAAEGRISGPANKLPILVAQAKCTPLTEVLACGTPRVFPTHVTTIDAMSVSSDVYLWVGAADLDVSGIVSLTITLKEATTPENDTCDESTPSLVFHDRIAEGEGRTRGGQNDIAELCGKTDGPDVFYSFSIEAGAPQALEVAIAPLGESSFRPAFSIIGACGSTQSKLCNAAPNAGANALGAIYSLPAGDYHLVVGSVGGSSGDFKYWVRKGETNVGSDKCPAAAVALSDLRATVAGNTVIARDDIQLINIPGQSVSTGGDLVYRIDVPATSRHDAHIVIRPTKSTPWKLRPIAALRAVCEGDALALAMGKAENPGDELKLFAPQLSPGPYYLWVDSMSTAEGGGFEVDFELTPSLPGPENDLCGVLASTKIELTEHGGALHAELPGSTVGARNDYSGGCALLNGADITYQFTTAVPMALRATVVAASGYSNYYPGLYLRTSCEATGDLQCGGTYLAGRPQTSAFVYEPNLPAGTYYLFVDGRNLSEGEFFLELNGYPTQGNSTCAAARPIVLAEGEQTVTLRGDTAFGGDEPSCAEVLSSKGLYYSFQVPAGQHDVEIVVAPSENSYIIPTVDIRSDCQHRADLHCDVMPYTALEEIAATYRTRRLHLGRLHEGLYQLAVHSERRYSHIPSPDDSFLLTFTMKSASDAAPNDRCPTEAGLNSHKVSFTAGVATILGDTQLGGADAEGSCAKSRLGGDLVYEIELTTMKTLVAEITASDDLAFYLRTACADPGAEVKCVPARMKQGKFNALDPGIYYLWVDTTAPGKEGPFTLRIEMTEPSEAPPDNDVCQQPIPLVPSGAGRAVLRGLTTANARDHYRGSCQKMDALHNGPDLVYSFTPSETTKATARVMRLASSPGFSPAVYWANGCSAQGVGATISCGNELEGIAQAVAPKLLAGETYMLVVDGIDGTEGSFDLELALAPAEELPSTCFYAERIDAEILAGTPVRGDTALSTNSSISTTLFREEWGEEVYLGTGPDLVYTFTTQLESDFSASLYFALTTGDAIIYLRDACAVSGGMTEWGAVRANGGPANLTIPNLPAGNYWLWVDSGMSLRGDFSLEVKVTPPASAPANTLCDNSTPALAVDGTWVTGTTLRAPNATTGTCGAMNGGEVIYKVDLSGQASRRSLNIKLRPLADTPAARLALYLRDGCGAPFEEPLCGVAPAAGTSEFALTQWYLAPKVYYLYVDGVDGGSGPFELSATLGEARLYPDNCGAEGPVALSQSGADYVATLSGDTSMGNDDTQWSACPMVAQMRSYNDFVYKLDTHTIGTRTLRAVMRHTSTTHKATLYLRDLCRATERSHELGCGQATANTGPATLYIEALPEGVYYLWVDSSASTAAQTTQGSSFKVDITLSPAAPVPSAVCSSATPLSLGASGTVTIEGNTKDGAESDYGSCAAMPGRSVYYSVSVPAGKRLLASVTRLPPASVLTPALYIRSDCTVAPGGTTGQLACHAGLSSGGALAITEVMPSTQNVIVVVDSAVGTGGALFGAYSLTLTAIGTSTNVCADAAAVAVSTTPVTVVGTIEATTGAFAPRCKATGSGGDALFKFSYPVGTKAIAFDLRPFPGSALQPILSVGASCAVDAADLCIVGTALTPLGAVYPVPAGSTQAYVWVDSNSTTAALGSFTLTAKTVEQLNPPGETCGEALALPTFDASWQTRLSGQTNLGAANDGVLTECFPGSSGQDGTGPDRWYKFTIDGTEKRSAQIAIIPSRSQRQVAALYSACSLSRESLMACSGTLSAAGVPTVLSAPSLSPGSTYFLAVKSDVNQFVDDYSIEISLGLNIPNSVANDTCATPERLTLDSAGRASARGLIQAATATTSPINCISGTAPNGPDHFFEFELTQTSKVSVKLSSLSQFYMPLLYVRTDCTDDSSQLACSPGSEAGQAMTLTFGALAPRKYTVIVDALSKNPPNLTWTGEFLLEISTEPSTNLAHDDCSGAYPLAFEDGRASYWGHIDDLTGSTSGKCGVVDMFTGISMPGPDAVFTFTTTVPKRLMATVTAEGGFPPSVYLRANTCDDSSFFAEKACHSQKTGSWWNSVASFTKASLPPGKYYLWVDSASLPGKASGGFWLDVLLDDVATYPAGESCHNPIALTKDDPAPAEYTTVGAEDDYSNPDRDSVVCKGLVTTATYAAADRVFSYTAQPGESFIVSVPCTSTKPFDVAFWVTKGECGSRLDCVAGADATNKATEAECRETLTTAITNSGTAPETYYIVVDSKSTGTGSFNVLVTTPPTP